MRKLTTYFIIFFFILYPSYSYSGEKVAFVDLDYILSNSKSGKKILNELSDLNNENIKKFQLEEKKLMDAKKEIDNLKNIISIEEYNKKIIKFQEDVNKYDSNKNNIIKSFEKIKNDELNNFFSNLNTILNNYMEKNLIGIILDKKNIIISKTELDITEDILQIVEKNDKIE